MRLGEVFTSNVGEDPKGQEEADLISVLTPGVRVTGVGRHAEFSADYEAQGLLFLNSGQRTRVNHRLIGNGTAELLDDWLYVDADSTISQQVVQADQRITLDNFNLAGNRANVYSLGVSPYLLHHFGHWASAELRYGYDVVRADRGFSDSEITRYSGRVVSGREFSRLSWALSYRNQDVKRQPARDAHFESTEGNAGYRLWRGLSVVGTAGVQQNELATTQRTIDGSYYAAGLRWSPNPHYSVEALAGSRLKTATIELNPTRRTHMRVAYRNREVGINPGAVWDGNLSLRTRHSQWGLNYHEDTITLQQLAAFEFTPQNLSQIGFDPLTGQLIDLTTGLPFVFGPNGAILSLTDEVIQRRRGRGTFSYTTGKSRFGVNLYREERTFLTNPGSQTVDGVHGHWRWNFGVRTALNLSSGLQMGDFEQAGSKRETNIYYGEVKMERSLTGRLQSTLEGTPEILRPGLDLSLAYRYTQHDSTGSGNDFYEHRISVFLTAKF